MQILINGAAELVEPEPGARLDRILMELRALMGAQRLAVLEMRLDGEPLDLTRAVADHGALASDHELLEIQAVGVHSLSLDILRQARDVIPRVSTCFTSAANLIISGKPELAGQPLGEGLEASRLLLTSLATMRQLFDLDLSQIEVGGSSLGAHTRKLGEVLNDIHESTQADDMVSVADQLEYELPPLLDSWREALDQLEGHVRTDAQRQEIQLCEP